MPYDIYHLHVKSKEEKDTNELIYITDTENKFNVTKGER